MLGLICFYLALNPTYTVSSVYWWVRTNKKENKLSVALSFPFLLYFHFQHKWWANTGSNMIKKGYDEGTFTSFQLRSRLCFQRKILPVGAVSANYSVIDTTCLIVLAMSLLELPWTWVHRNAVSMERLHCCMWLRWQGRMDTYTVLISSTHVHSPLFHHTSLSRHKLKDEIAKNFKTAIAEH